MEEVKVSINDVKKAVYFITNLTQMQGDRPMQGALSSKADYMGGIFDRWINIIPESVLFNKVILPKVFPNHNVEVITDYYDYNPKIAGIAPDVIGIKYNKRAIPFVKFNNHWEPVPKAPQIEVKTYKKNQYMVSLRDQRYKDYLVLAETNFRVDYLVPIINEALYSDEIFLDLHMNDKIFIVSNDRGIIGQTNQINLSNKSLGTVKLLTITTADSFKKKAIKCEAGVSAEYFKTCEEYVGDRPPKEFVANLLEYCTKHENGLYYFNSKWYDNVDENGMSYKNGKKVRNIGFSLSNPKHIDILKINKSNFYIKANKDCYLQNQKLLSGHIYLIELGQLDRSSNKGEEYFLSKSDINVLDDSFEKLSSDLKKIVIE